MKTPMNSYKPDSVVKTCHRIQTGLHLGPYNVQACCYSHGAVEAPPYWSADKVPQNITKEMLINKRIELFERLNDPDDNDFLCRKCTQWKTTTFNEVSFDKVELINVAADSRCNLRCDYCGFTHDDHFKRALYDPLAILKCFTPEDVTLDASVDFNQGEPTLQSDLADYLSYFERNKIRTRVYSNGVIFSEVLYDAVKRGAVTWLIISVDAGTASTWLKTKKSNTYIQCIRNLAAYRKVCDPNVTKVAAKYIFTDRTMEDDDIYGFVYAVKAAGVDSVELNLDYDVAVVASHRGLPMANDYFSKVRIAYRKMYIEFLKWGITPIHFFEESAASMGSGRLALDSIKKDIEEELARLSKRDASKSEHDPDKINIVTFNDRYDATYIECNATAIEEIVSHEQLESRKILIAPMGRATENFMKHECVKRLNISGFADLSVSKAGRTYNGVTIYPYGALGEIHFDTVLLLSKAYATQILDGIHKANSLKGKKILLIHNQALLHR